MSYCYIKFKFNITFVLHPYNKFKIYNLTTNIITLVLVILKFEEEKKKLACRTDTAEMTKS